MNKYRVIQKICNCLVLCGLVSFFSSCATTVPSTPKIMPPVIPPQVQDLEIIMSNNNFDFIYPIDRCQCDENGKPLTTIAVVPSSSTVVTNLSYLQEGAMRKTGGTVQIDFTMSAGDYFDYVIPLKECDLSKGEAVTFLFNASHLSANNISLLIEDNNGTHVSATAYCVPVQDDWQRIYFKLSDFAGLNADYLKTVSIRIQANNDMTGVVKLDNIFMAGNRHFVAKSREDNLALFSQENETVSVPALLSYSREELLRFIAQETWNYFVLTVDKQTHLPVDRVDMDSRLRVSNFTSTTNMGMYLASCVAAQKFGFIDAQELNSRVGQILDVLDKLKQWEGFYFNYYHTSTLEPTSGFVSSIDNGWLAIGLCTVRAVVPIDLQTRIDAIVSRMNFKKFYNETLSHLRLGYDVETQSPSPYDYGLLCTEARATSFLGIGKGDLPLMHWFKMFRTFPPNYDWQRSKPQGIEKMYLGQKIFSGYYQYNDLKIVPSWGGSLFEFLMPSLFIDERRLGVQALGENNKRAVQGQIAYAKEKEYVLWGLSPCAVPSKSKRAYGEFGVPPLSAKGYSDQPVITPHVSFLALPYAPDDAMRNIKKMLVKYPQLMSSYGFYDAVDLRTGDVAKTYLCLDQAMILVSLCNFLNDDYIVDLFHQHEYAKNAKRVLLIEQFYE